eukprot:4264582-Prymnesium_polylepis.1
MRQAVLNPVRNTCFVTGCCAGAERVWLKPSAEGRASGRRRSRPSGSGFVVVWTPRGKAAPRAWGAGR